MSWMVWVPIIGTAWFAGGAAVALWLGPLIARHQGTRPPKP